MVLHPRPAVRASRGFDMTCVVCGQPTSGYDLCQDCIAEAKRMAGEEEGRLYGKPPQLVMIAISMPPTAGFRNAGMLLRVGRN